MRARDRLLCVCVAVSTICVCVPSFPDSGLEGKVLVDNKDAMLRYQAGWMDRSMIYDKREGTKTKRDLWDLEP
jgi:hypothetical protein